jgi:hypothetical protein
MSLQDTLTLARTTLNAENIQFALIGGFALAAHGIVRATQDIDFLVDGAQKEKARTALSAVGFRLVFESLEVLQFSGVGQLDILLANREASKKMLSRAKTIENFPVPVVAAEDLIGLKIQAFSNDPNRSFQDKADIQALMSEIENLDYDLIKSYADLFDQWAFIFEIRSML